MKLPIYLHIEDDSIWTTYKAELDKVQGSDELKTFAKRWNNLLATIKPEDLTEEILVKIKSETIDASTARISELAYSKWEQAGRPVSDGVEFWLQAEREVIGSANLIAELSLPVAVVKAMLVAQEHVVPLNCAFIQMNGGLGEFED